MITQKHKLKLEKSFFCLDIDYQDLFLSRVKPKILKMRRKSVFKHQTHIHAHNKTFYHTMIQTYVKQQFKWEYAKFQMRNISITDTSLARRSVLLKSPLHLLARSQNSYFCAGQIHLFQEVILYSRINHNPSRSAFITFMTSIGQGKMRHPVNKNC